MEQPPIITGIRLRVSHDDTYEKSFDTAYTALKANENYENKIPFVFLGIAYLEYCLNLTIIDFFNNEFTEQYSETFARYYLRSLPLKAKVDLLPSILSHNQFIADTQSDPVQPVSLLVGVRNKVTHHADFYQTIDNVQNVEGASLFAVSTADENLNKISQANIDRVYNAVKTYVNEVCKKYSATETIVEGNIIKRTK
jgi:hypothetical protein